MRLSCEGGRALVMVVIAAVVVGTYARARADEVSEDDGTVVKRTTYKDGKP